MSRTDAHAPAFVRLLDPHRRVAVHDHSTGPCDLLPLEEWLKDTPGWREVRCRWDVRFTDFIENPCCGCSMCTGKAYRRDARRRERHDSRRVIQDGLSDWLDDLDEARAEQEAADYEASVQAKWTALIEAVEEYRAAEELALQREAQLRGFMEAVPGVIRPTFL